MIVVSVTARSDANPLWHVQLHSDCHHSCLLTSTAYMQPICSIWGKLVVHIFAFTALADIVSLCKADLLLQPIHGADLVRVAALHIESRGRLPGKRNNVSTGCVHCWHNLPCPEPQRNFLNSVSASQLSACCHPACGIALQCRCACDLHLQWGLQPLQRWAIKDSKAWCWSLWLPHWRGCLLAEGIVCWLLPVWKAQTTEILALSTASTCKDLLWFTAFWGSKISANFLSGQSPSGQLLNTSLTMISINFSLNWPV